jgi:muramoyltetrapeptide carboxypeptidase
MFFIFSPKNRFHTMNNRRHFLGATLGLTATCLLPHSLFGQQQPATQGILLPPRLKKGDTIGLVAPGYSIKSEVVEEIKKTLIKMGFLPYHTPRILGSHGYFSNTDAERAKDLNELFSSPHIDGILCARGGYGCARIMHLLDYGAIKNNPKVLIGFSDVTALLNGIHKETGLIGFHGPVGSTLDDPYSISQLEKVLIDPQPNLLIENVVELDRKLLSDPVYARYVITPGMAYGKLVGGNLTLITSMIGTPHEIDFTNAVVCLEDVDEAPYRMDRMLTQLIQSSTFKNAAGIVFGACSGCRPKPHKKSFTLKEVIMDRISPLGIPAVYGMSFGHVKNNFTFPIGLEARLDAAKMTIQLSGMAVL